MKKSNWGLVCSIVGAVVIAGAAVAALIHFWDDIKKLLPCCNCSAECDEFADIEE